MNDPFRLEFDDDGSLHQRGREGWREAVCPVCSEPIRWVLEMMSFTRDETGFALAHARCVWTREAFGREALRASPA